MCIKGKSNENRQIAFILWQALTSVIKHCRMEKLMENRILSTVTAASLLLSKQIPSTVAAGLTLVELQNSSTLFLQSSQSPR